MTPGIRHHPVGQHCNAVYLRCIGSLLCDGGLATGCGADDDTDAGAGLGPVAHALRNATGLALPNPGDGGAESTGGDFDEAAKPPLLMPPAPPVGDAAAAGNGKRDRGIDALAEAATGDGDVSATSKPAAAPADVRPDGERTGCVHSSMMMGSSARHNAATFWNTIGDDSNAMRIDHLTHTQIGRTCKQLGHSGGGIRRPPLTSLPCHNWCRHWIRIAAVTRRQRPQARDTGN